MNTQGKLRFDDLGTGADRHNKQSRWAVIDLTWARIMGTVDWSEHGGLYYFIPEGSQGFDANDLATIAEFVKTANAN